MKNNCQKIRKKIGEIISAPKLSGVSTRNEQGFTLIEVLVGVLILVILIFGVYGMYDYSLKMAREKSRREGAVAVANEEMEYFRSIDYDNLGTAATLCSPNPEGCTISSVKNVVRNGINYTVLTDISYVDDIFDNADQDPEGDDETGLNDYKTARIEVGWASTFSNNSVTLVSTFAPIGIETDCGGGILKINVVGENLQPVPQAGVYIKNDNIGYEYDTKTNNEGKLRKGCLPEDLNNNYEITINKPPAGEDERPFYKNAYSIAQTCPTGTGTPNPICPKPLLDNATPDPQHVNINEGGITEITFFIDLLSTLNITTITQNLPNEWVVNKTPDDENIQKMPTMAIGPGDDYYYFWQEDNGGQIRLYAQKYNSSKIAQWNSGSDVQITTSNDEVYPSIVVGMASGDVYVAWYHTSTGNQEAYIKKIASADGSMVWNAELDVSATQNSKDQSIPKIRLEDDENFIYLTYLDNTDDTNDLYVARFATTDGTQDEWTTETKINDDGNGNEQASQSILIEPGTDDLVAVWHDNRDGDNDIYTQKINPDGNYDGTWNANIKINEDGAEEQLNPSIAMSQEGINKFFYIVWQDDRNGNFDIYLAKYKNDGTRWWEHDKRLTTSDSDQTTPVIAINPNDNAIYAAWVDERNGNPDIYLQKFNSSGDPLWDDDLRINNDQAIGGSIQGVPQLAINSSDEVVVTWQDNDDGDYDIRTAIIADDPNPTIEGDVPLRIYGSKTIGKDVSENNIYKFDSTFTTDSNGELKFDGSDQSKLEWDSYTIEINGASYNLLRSEPPTPITISPNTTNNIILTVESAT